MEPHARPAAVDENATERDIEPGKGTTSPDRGTTLVEVLAGYAAGGFAGSFGVEHDGRLRCDACDQVFDAATVRMSSLRRMEGESDPDDMLAVVALTCPACRTEGTVALGYGPMASAEDSTVLTRLQDFRDDDAAPQSSAPGEALGDD